MVKIWDGFDIRFGSYSDKFYLFLLEKFRVNIKYQWVCIDDIFNSKSFIDRLVDDRYWKYQVFSVNYITWWEMIFKWMECVALKRKIVYI
jgi:hypothetical protein